MTTQRALTISAWAGILTMIVAFTTGWLMLLAVSKLESLDRRMEEQSKMMSELYAQQLAMKTRLDYHERMSQ